MTSLQKLPFIKFSVVNGIPEDKTGPYEDIVTVRIDGRFGDSRLFIEEAIREKQERVVRDSR
jgi:hypothetical protein